ncbi:acyltransferase family protein [Verrucomicrobium spinosum]|uniref:acyltransferase family protein n=2 Tax=Verrucomicrobium spinosum TaxID=2736 RepID=UPI0009D6B9CC|nr:acyltransferase [Verrucomicrobium spinosum]
MTEAVSPAPAACAPFSPETGPVPPRRMQGQRQPGLDILRCLAVVLVLGSHFPVCPEETSRPVHHVTQMLRTGGWVGVDLFFVLSGFLVSGLIFAEWHKTGSVRVVRFMVRRSFKIIPSLYCLVVVTVVVQHLSGGVVPWKGVAGELLFLQNYYHRLWQHTWSLAVEEHFYTLVALVAAWCLWKRKPWHNGKALSASLLAVCAICLGVRIYNASLHPEFAEYLHLYKTHLRLDTLAFGVLIASYWHRPDSRLPAWAQKHTLPLILAGSLGFLPFFLITRQTHWLMYTAGLTLLALASGALLLGLATMKPGKQWAVAALTFVGRNSYGIYLWHLALPRWLGLIPGLKEGGSLDWWTLTAIYWAGAILLGVISTRLVETPFLALRNRFFQARTA